MIKNNIKDSRAYVRSKFLKIAVFHIVYSMAMNFINKK